MNMTPLWSALVVQAYVLLWAVLKLVSRQLVSQNFSLQDRTLLLLKEGSTLPSGT
jgi:hypothetical protein